MYAAQQEFSLVSFNIILNRYFASFTSKEISKDSACEMNLRVYQKWWSNRKEGSGMQCNSFLLFEDYWL